MTNFTHKFYTDPGHGWLQVDLDDLTTLGIFDKISRYSYYDQDWVYLEEDCDMGLYLDAMKTLGLSVIPETIHSSQDSWIRDFARFPESRFRDSRLCEIS